MVVKVPVVSVRLPLVAKAAPRLNVRPVWLIVTAPTVTAPLVNVTTPVPELASNCGVSADVGTEAPPAPPDVADQLAVFVLLQVPAPPTQ